LARGLDFATVPLWRASAAPPQLPASLHPVRGVIKDYEAVYLSSLTDREITHEILIKAVAEQMGSAHEDEGVDGTIHRLRRIFLGGVQIYVPILALDAELALQVGERVLDRAEKHHGYRRVVRGLDDGDVTVLVRFGLCNQVAGRVPVVTLRSEISEVEITCSAGPLSAVFEVKKRGRPVCDLEATYPAGWELWTDSVFAISYSSAHRQVRTMTNDRVTGGPVDCDLGWLDAREVRPTTVHKEREGLVYIQWAGLVYERLLQSNECGELSRLSPDLSELRLKEPPTSVFPP
jgi:hypothetical protein